MSRPAFHRRGIGGGTIITIPNVDHSPEYYRNQTAKTMAKLHPPPARQPRDPEAFQKACYCLWLRERCYPHAVIAKVLGKDEAWCYRVLSAATAAKAVPVRPTDEILAQLPKGE